MTDLESLIRALVPSVAVTHEPAKVTDSGNPDFVVTRNLGGDPIPIGYIEAKAAALPRPLCYQGRCATKAVGKNLNSKSYREQFARYKRAG